MFPAIGSPTMGRTEGLGYRLTAGGAGPASWKPAHGRRYKIRGIGKEQS